MLSDEEADLLGFLVRESGRPVTFLALFQRDDIPEACPRRGVAPRRYPGAVPQTSPLALTREINMRNPFSFAAYKSWGRVFEDKSEAGAARRLRRPGIPQCVPRGDEEGDRVQRRLAPHHRP